MYLHMWTASIQHTYTHARVLSMRIWIEKSTPISRINIAHIDVHWKCLLMSLYVFGVSNDIGLTTNFNYFRFNFPVIFFSLFLRWLCIVLFVGPIHTLGNNTFDLYYRYYNNNCPLVSFPFLFLYGGILWCSLFFQYVLSTYSLVLHFILLFWHLCTSKKETIYKYLWKYDFMKAHTHIRVCMLSPVPTLSLSFSLFYV